MVMNAGAPALIATTTEYLTQGVPSGLSFPASSGVKGATVRPRHAYITVEQNAVRWGLNPTATTGTVTQVGGVIDFTDPVNDFTGVIQQVQFIALNGNAVLQVQMFT